VFTIADCLYVVKYELISTTFFPLEFFVCFNSTLIFLKSLVRFPLLPEAVITLFFIVNFTKRKYYQNFLPSAGISSCVVLQMYFISEYIS